METTNITFGHSYKTKVSAQKIQFKKTLPLTKCFHSSTRVYTLQMAFSLMFTLAFYLSTLTKFLKETSINYQRGANPKWKMINSKNLSKSKRPKKKRKLKDKTKGSQRKIINKKLKERMPNSKRIRWSNSRKLYAEIYMQSM